MGLLLGHLKQVLRFNIQIARQRVNTNLFFRQATTPPGQSQERRHGAAIRETMANLRLYGTFSVCKEFNWGEIPVREDRGTAGGKKFGGTPHRKKRRNEPVTPSQGVNRFFH